MTKYLSLVHANINDISQLKKESEYRSVFTDDIELVSKNVFFWIDLQLLDLMTHCDQSHMTASMDGYLGCVKWSTDRIASELFRKEIMGFERWC